MANQWFYRRGEEKFGPVTVEQLKVLATSRRISSTDLILKEGTEQWVNAGRFKALFIDQTTDQSAAPEPESVIAEAIPRQPSEPLRNDFRDDGSADGKPVLKAEAINAAFSAARRRGAGLVGRFKQIDFKREVWPLDAAAFRTLTGEPAFWAVTMLSALPLFFATLTEPEYQLNAFALYFAAIWGLIFRFSVIPGVRIGWGWLATALLFTGAVGISLLIKVAYPCLPT